MTLNSTNRNLVVSSNSKENLEENRVSAKSLPALKSRVCTTRLIKPKTRSSEYFKFENSNRKRKLFPDNFDTVKMKLKEKISDSVNRSSREQSALGKDSNHCLCIVFRPILYLCVIFGLIPISHHKDEGKCKITHSWKSWPTFVNLLWILGNCVGLTCWYPSIIKLFKTHLHGTDFYTHTISWTIQIFSTIALFIVGNSSAIYFSKAWDKLHVTLEELALKNFRILKYLGYLIPIFLAQDVIGGVLLIGLTNLVSQIRMDLASWAVNGVTIISNFLPNLSTLTFILLCYIVSKNFGGINKELRELGRQISFKDKAFVIGSADEENGAKVLPEIKIVKRIARLRALHENLCESVRRLEKAFGAQMIAVFVGTGISFVAGVYEFAIATQGLNSLPKNLSLLLAARALNSIFSGLRLVMVVCSCQILKNQANEAGNILNNYNAQDASAETQQEVKEFLNKVGLFPIKITACNVFELGTGYLAAAAGNVITYVLILMQFKLDQPSPLEFGSEEEFRNATTISDS